MVVEIEEVRSGMVVVVISINKQIAAFSGGSKAGIPKKSELRLKPIFLFLQIGTGSRKVMTTGLFLASQPSKNARTCSCLVCGFFCTVEVGFLRFVLNMTLSLDTVMQIAYMHTVRGNFVKVLWKYLIYLGSWL